MAGWDFPRNRISLFEFATMPLFVILSCRCQGWDAGHGSGASWGMGTGNGNARSHRHNPHKANRFSKFEVFSVVSFLETAFLPLLKVHLGNKI
jgi:hypothetical protein